MGKQCWKLLEGKKANRVISKENEEACYPSMVEGLANASK